MAQVEEVVQVCMLMDQNGVGYDGIMNNGNQQGDKKETDDVCWAVFGIRACFLFYLILYLVA